MRFYVGLHQPSDARHFDRCLISIARLRDRKSNFQVQDWILDSGAFTEVATHGDYREPVEVYARQIKACCQHSCNQQRSFFSSRSIRLFWAIMSV